MLIFRKPLFVIALVTALILLVPLVAMQFTSQVHWQLNDFIIAGALIFGTGLLLDFARRKAGKYRLAVILSIILFFLYIWAELAVGIFTNWGS